MLVPTFIILVAAGLLAFALVGFGSGGSDSATGSNQHVKHPEDQPKVDVDARRDEDDPMAMGDADAPVVMIEYSDFQCPFCGKFARDIHPDLIDQYVKDGTLRIEWRDFPYLGDDSWKSARAGRAAADQGKFWQFHDAIYADQPDTNSGDMTDEFLAGIAGDIGLDVKKFNKDLHSDKYTDDIKTDFDEGQSLGVSAAPSFFINGIPLVGAQAKAAFTDVIDHEAGAAK